MRKFDAAGKPRLFAMKSPDNSHINRGGPGRLIRLATPYIGDNADASIERMDRNQPTIINKHAFSIMAKINFLRFPGKSHMRFSRPCRAAKYKTASLISQRLASRMKNRVAPGHHRVLGFLMLAIPTDTHSGSRRIACVISQRSRKRGEIYVPSDGAPARLLRQCAAPRVHEPGHHFRCDDTVGP